MGLNVSRYELDDSPRSPIKEPNLDSWKNGNVGIICCSIMGSTFAWKEKIVSKLESDIDERQISHLVPKHNRNGLVKLISLPISFLSDDLQLEKRPIYM
jgi:hypothetical protein